MSSYLWSGVLLSEHTEAPCSNPSWVHMAFFMTKHNYRPPSRFGVLFMGFWEVAILKWNRAEWLCQPCTCTRRLKGTRLVPQSQSFRWVFQCRRQVRMEERLFSAWVLILSAGNRSWEMYQWVFTWGKESSLHSSTFHSVSLQKGIIGEPHSSNCKYHQRQLCQWP